MPELLSQETLREMASRWLSPSQVPKRFRIDADTTDFFCVEYDDVVVLKGSPYLIRHNAKEQRFGLEDEVKFWVKRAIDLESGDLKILKLVFYEKFLTHIGDIEFVCYRSPRKEARILELVAGHRSFMQGHAVTDAKGNLIRVLDFITGDQLTKFITNIKLDHEEYFFEQLPDVLNRFMSSIEAIRFLHDHGEKHGDIRRDHILVDRDDGRFRWIDFDFNYRHRENIFGYDLFGLGNILVFLVGMGDVLVRDLADLNPDALKGLAEEDFNIVFHNRVANLRKIYPYIPVALNRVLMHFSIGTNVFYEHTSQLLSDLGEVMEAHFSSPGNQTEKGTEHGESGQSI
jgi:serine/threonine protein kinase